MSDEEYQKYLEEMMCRMDEHASEELRLYWDYRDHASGYIGASTRSEIDYADAAGKVIQYLEPLS